MTGPRIPYVDPDRGTAHSGQVLATRGITSDLARGDYASTLIRLKPA